MPTTDPRIDAYIDAAAEFARPLLRHLRAVVHAGCPAVEETIKWRMPHFMYRGAILASMAAFRGHATFGFWRGEELGAGGRSDQAMGQFGRIERLDDLPPRDQLEALVRRAVALADAGPPPRRVRATKAAATVVPDDFAAALDADPAARRHFDAFSPSHRREYVDWIVEARRAETRARRIAQAVAQLAEGKSRNWKYERC